MDPTGTRRRCYSQLCPGDQEGLLPGPSRHFLKVREGVCGLPDALEAASLCGLWHYKCRSPMANPWPLHVATARVRGPHTFSPGITAVGKRGVCRNVTPTHPVLSNVCSRSTFPPLPPYCTTQMQDVKHFTSPIVLQAADVKCRSIEYIVLWLEESPMTRLSTHGATLPCNACPLFLMGSLIQDLSELLCSVRVWPLGLVLWSHITFQFPYIEWSGRVSIVSYV